MDIKHNINAFNDKLSSHNCKLIAVSKRKPLENILEAYEAGHRDFGENQVQELVGKVPELPSDINWHMIGHLQRNKVKYLAPFVHMIHAVDSSRLLAEIEKQAANNGREIPCLLQIHIAREETKFGFSENEVLEIIGSEMVRNLKWAKVIGLMGMATNTDDKQQVKREFQELKSVFDKIGNQNLPHSIQMKELSMGMTSDYDIALESGSTMIRVGSAIFGPRN
jgi:pyridoxal phosphate enzyme (YggS family)